MLYVFDFIILIFIPPLYVSPFLPPILLSIFFLLFPFTVFSFSSSSYISAHTIACQGPTQPQNRLPILQLLLTNRHDWFTRIFCFGKTTFFRQITFRRWTSEMLSFNSVCHKLLVQSIQNFLRRLKTKSPVL